MAPSWCASASSSRRCMIQPAEPRCIRLRRRRRNTKCGRRISWLSSGSPIDWAERFLTEKGEFLYQRPDGGLSKVTPGKTSLKFVQKHEQVAGLYRSPLKKVLSAAVQAMGLSVLLAGGTIYTIQHQNPQFTRPSALVEM